MAGEWDCPVCTLINRPGTTRCNACDTKNPNIASSSPTLKLDGDDATAKEACDKIWSEKTLSVLLTLVGNAADNPEEPKYRGPVSKSKERIKTLIVDAPGASTVLRAAGFEEDESCFMIRELSKERLSHVRQLLQARERVVENFRLKQRADEDVKRNQEEPPSQVEGSRYVVRRKQKFDEDLLREIEAERRTNARWAMGATAGGAYANASQEAAQTEVARALPAPGHDGMRIRLRLPFGGQMDLSVESNETVVGFMTSLAARTGVPISHQQIRFGFPPIKIKGASGAQGKLLVEAGLHDGDVVHLENLNDIFLGKLESGTFTMRELLEELPPGEGEDGNDTGMLFIEALETLGIGLDERNFWSVVHDKMEGMMAGDAETDPVELKLGLSMLRRLFSSYDPRQRLALCVEHLKNDMDGDMDAAVEIECNREALFDSVAKTVLGLSHQELLSPTDVHFIGETGVDGGGLTRNMFSEFAQRMVDSEPLLWHLTGRGSLEPTANVVSENATHSSGLPSSDLYRACGRVFGMATLQGCTLGRQLSRPFVKLLIGDPPQRLDELQDELNYEVGESAPDFRGGKLILERPFAESGLAGAKLTRSITTNPEVGEVELVPGGADIEVTDANKTEWLTALLNHKLVVSQQFAATAFRDGIIDVFGGRGDFCPLLCLLSANELVELWGGRGIEVKDVERWKAVAQVSPYVERQAEWLWQVLKEDYDDELRAQVLCFATGTSRIGRDGVQHFCIEPADGGDDRLPSAMTCGNMLQLPQYSSRFVLAKQLRLAAETCSTFQLR